MLQNVENVSVLVIFPGITCLMAIRPVEAVKEHLNLVAQQTFSGLTGNQITFICGMKMPNETSF